MDTPIIFGIVFIAIGFIITLYFELKTTHLISSLDKDKLPVPPDSYLFLALFRPVKALKIAREIKDEEVLKSQRIKPLPVALVIIGMLILLIYPFF